MSFFYLIPAKGKLPVHLLETIVNERIIYLNALLKGDAVLYSEYMIEGGVYDNVGHFILCLLSILYKNDEFTQFLKKSEIELFKKRLASLSSYDLRCFSKKLLKTIKKSERIPRHIKALQVLCQHLTLKELAQHVASTDHSNNCCDHNIYLNFKLCIQFLAKREVELKNGLASIPCGKWRQYLILLFSTHLKKRFSGIDLHTLECDPRILDLLNKVKNDMLPFFAEHGNNNIIFSKDVDKISNYFPPCMLNLYKTLRQKHRLSHYQRFYFSLFLKDIGMPVEEALDFWRNEYIQSPNGYHSCCHNWEKDEKRYIYGIRHAYGLEGGRKNYLSYSCHHIQSAESSCSEGGCPFKSFDNDKLSHLLQTEDSSLSQIYKFKENNQYISACLLYLQIKFHNNCDNVRINFTPVKYYEMLSKSALMD